MWCGSWCRAPLPAEGLHRRAGKTGVRSAPGLRPSLLSLASSLAPFRSTMPLLLLIPSPNLPSGASNRHSLFILSFYLQKHRITLLNKNSEISDTNRISLNMYQNELMKRCSSTSMHCNRVNFSLILRLFFPQGLII